LKRVISDGGCDAGRGERQEIRAERFFAAERTFLASIRTGIAWMGFGFGVARFGLFLQALGAAVREIPAPSSGMSVAFRTALIVIGVAVNVLSAWNHVRLVRGLSIHLEHKRPSTAAIRVAVLLAVIGTALAICLVMDQGIQRAI